MWSNKLTTPAPRGGGRCHPLGPSSLTTHVQVKLPVAPCVQLTEAVDDVPAPATHIAINNVSAGLRAASPPPGHKPERRRIVAPIPSCDGLRSPNAAPLRLAECLAENVALHRPTKGRAVMVTITGQVARSWLCLCASPVFPSKEEFGRKRRNRLPYWAVTARVESCYALQASSRDGRVGYGVGSGDCSMSPGGIEPEFRA